MSELERLRKLLESIPKTGAINRGRRMAIIAQINALTGRK